MGHDVPNQHRKDKHMQHTRLTKMSANQLHNTLIKRHLSDARIKEIKEWVAKRKELINKNRIEKQVRQRRWTALIRPLSRHIASVKTNIKYHASQPNNAETHHFYTDYLALLEETRGYLTSIKLSRETTPTQHDRTKRDWTDYLKKETKEKLIKRYNSIPYTSKYSHRRELFPRPTPRKELSK